MKYYVSTSLPKHIFERVEQIERKWQGESASDPHLTLMVPRTLLPGKTETELVQAINTAIYQIPIFSIIMTGGGYFGNKENIHICVKRTSELVACHEAIMRATEGILAPVEGEFGHLPHPHISLASRLTPEKGDQAWEALKDEDFAFCFACTAVYLQGKEPKDKCWRHIETIVIGCDK